MTQEEILEYNKRCAKFLGVDVDYSTEVYKDSKSPLRHYIDNKPKSEPLLFHSDWNWIMEVVKAIEELNMEISIIDEECSIIDTEKAEKEENPFMIEPVSFGEGETKKEAVVQAINQFLIWYNENN